MELQDKTAIVILNYKNFQDTVNCVNSIINNDNKDYLIIVVDNDSKNDSLNIIQKQLNNSIKIQYWTGELAEGTEVLLVQNNKNTGYAAGNNVGLRIGHNLGFKYLMVLNNDTLFFDHSLDILVEFISKNDNVICAGPMLYKGNGTLDYNCAKRRPTYLDFFILSYFGRWFKTTAWEKDHYYVKKFENIEQPLEVDIISGSCMLFDAEKLHAIDYFDEHTFLYYEEAIIHEKAKLKGYKSMLIPKSRVVHLGAQTTKNHSHSDFTLKCGYESALYYLTRWRNLPMWQAKVICFSQYLFLNLYKFKSKK
jgi:GT2 family glycosyltransferase